MSTYDYEKDTLSIKARLMALDNHEFQDYKKIADGGMTKHEMKKYLNGNQEQQIDMLAQQEKERMAKEYPPHLQNPQFGEFWEDIKRKPQSRPSSATRASRDGPREETPTTKMRQYSLLP